MNSDNVRKLVFWDSISEKSVFSAVYYITMSTIQLPLLFSKYSVPQSICDLVYTKVDECTEEESFDAFVENDCDLYTVDYDSDDEEILSDRELDLGDLALYLYSMGFDRDEGYTIFSDYMVANHTREQLDNFAERNPFV